jgi:hypothetical protein
MRAAMSALGELCAHLIPAAEARQEAFDAYLSSTNRDLLYAPEQGRSDDSLDKRTRATGHITAAQIDRVNHLEITGIVFFKQRYPLSGVDGICDVKQSQPCHSAPGQRDLPHGLAVVHLKIAPTGCSIVWPLASERSADA